MGRLPVSVRANRSGGNGAAGSLAHLASPLRPDALLATRVPRQGQGTLQGTQGFHPPARGQSPLVSSLLQRKQ